MSIKTLLGAENPKKPYFFSTVKDFENGCFSQIMTKFHEKKLLNYDEKEEERKFFEPKYRDLRDPFLLNGMNEAVSRIKQAILRGEKICVYGDFDADGITSTVLLLSTIKFFGGKVIFFIPDREKDSHGLKNYVIEKLSKKDICLIVTVDCGCNDQKEIAFAKKLGIDVIVTDHHDISNADFPDSAVCVINPKQKSDFSDADYLAGVGVAFKLSVACKDSFCNSVGFSSLRSQTKCKSFVKSLLELVCIGTIADCVPLVGENRVLVKLGLQVLRNSSWKGLWALFSELRLDTKNIDEQDIMFRVAPILNAASRVGDVNQVVHLFCREDNFSSSRAQKLITWNDHRKVLTNQSLKEGISQIDDSKKVQFLFSGNWKIGILGLLASKICEQYHQPTVVCTSREDGFVAASCRSVAGISMVDILQQCGSQLFVYYGGHAGAAGFTCTRANLPKIREKITHIVSQMKDCKKRIDIFSELDPSEVSLRFTEVLSRFAPFGVGNREPCFVFHGIEIRDIAKLGKSGDHFKISGISRKFSNCRLNFLAFFGKELVSKLKKGQQYSLIFKFGTNEFQGRTELQYHLIDAAISPTKF